VRGMNLGYPTWLQVTWFWGWKVKCEDRHTVNKCIFHINIRNITQKTNDLKVFKLATENDLGISKKWLGFGVVERSKVKVRVKPLRLGLGYSNTAWVLWVLSSLINSVFKWTMLRNDHAKQSAMFISFCHASVAISCRIRVSRLSSITEL